MSNTLEKNAEIKVVGKSWVIQLPENFTAENNLAKGTQILLTFKNETVQAEILPPLSEKLENVANKILKKRSKMLRKSRVDSPSRDALFRTYQKSSVGRRK